MGGAAFSLSLIRSYKSREEWVEDSILTRPAYRDKPDHVRRELFGQIWDLAKEADDEAVTVGNVTEPPTGIGRGKKKK